MDRVCRLETEFLARDYELPFRNQTADSSGDTADKLTAQRNRFPGSPNQRFSRLTIAATISDRRLSYD